jgi:glycine cleavage system H lipoate-binding protein/ABC-type phosphate transport system substrate-binding protein
MRTRIFLIIGLLFLSCNFANSKEAEIGNNPSREGTIKVFTSPEIYNLTMRWTSEYSNLNPKLKVEVIKAADANIPRMLRNGAGIGFITNETNAAFSNQTVWNLVVGRDVIVPVMNAANPLMEEITRIGVTSKGLARVLENPDNHNWGKLLNNDKNIPLHFYVTNEASVKAGVANFIKANQIKIDGIKTVSEQELITAVQNDPNALGFCKLIQVIDPNNQSLLENIKLVPIDKNANGKIDYIENIYDNLQSFSRGVWIGKYPNALSGNIYSVSSGKPTNEAEVAFLKWVLTDGQQYLSKNGYNDLVLSERQAQLEKFDEPVFYVTAPQNSYANLKIFLLIFVAIVVIGYLLDLAFRRNGNKKRAIQNTPYTSMPVFDEDSVIIPKGLYFDKTHTWAFMKKDGLVKIGIDDFLQHITGGITRIEMKNTGEKIKKGDKLLTIIRKGKQLNIYSPVSGIIAEQNSDLIINSSLINSAPYADGWVYLIEPTNWLLEIQFLTMAEKYRVWLKDEFTRLKDFFASSLKNSTPEFAFVAFQDGGSLKDNILADLGPEVWEDFQTKFIDSVR